MHRKIPFVKEMYMSIFMALLIMGSGIISCSADEDKTKVAAPNRTTFVDCSSTNKTISMNWKEVSGASGYIIEEYNPGNKKYSVYKRISNNKTTSTKLKNRKPAKAYYFRIKAYKTNNDTIVYSKPSSKTIFTTKPNKIKNLKASSIKSSTVKLSWSKASGSGYMIQQKVGENWKTIKTIKGSSGTSYTVKDLKPNKKYSFRVRAYKSTDKKYYGKYSDTLTVKTAKKANSPKSTEKYAGYVIIGDSRMVGMSAASMPKSYGSKVKFIAKSSMGYNWMVNTAESELKTFLQNHSGKKYKIIISMGVNDLYNAENYINEFRRLKKEYPSHKFYFQSVNPVAKYTSALCTNSDISAFNKKIKAAFPDEYVDIYKYLIKDGYLDIDKYPSPDGLHYSESTNNFIFEKIISLIN